MQFLLTLKKTWPAIETTSEGTDTKTETRSSSKGAADLSELSADAKALIGLNVADHLLPEVSL